MKKVTVQARTKFAEAGRLARVLDGVRSPIDRVAARVAGKGVEFKSRKIVLTADQPTPIEVRPLSAVPTEHRDLVGRQFGTMKVLGLSFVPSRWVVRCICGVYTLRTARAIRNPDNASDCCEQCRHLLYLKRNEYWRRTGKEVEWCELPGRPGA